MTLDASAKLADLVIEDGHRARILQGLDLDYCCHGKRSLSESAATAALDWMRDLPQDTVCEAAASQVRFGGPLRRARPQIRLLVREHFVVGDNILFPRASSWTAPPPTIDGSREVDPPDSPRPRPPLFTTSRHRDSSLTSRDEPPFPAISGSLLLVSGTALSMA